MLGGVNLTLAPRYTTAKSSTVNAKTFALDLAASYTINRWASMFGSYALLHQRSRGSVGSIAGDIDQNRLSFGLLVRYPVDLN